MLKERFGRFMWGQARKPRGLFGRFFGNMMARTNVYDASWTLSLLNVQPESRVLEIGFGPGVSSQYASEIAARGFVAGIDHSETMVEASRRRNAAAIKAGRMDLQQGDVGSPLPYPDESFDRVFSIHSIYFWAKPVDCLKELRRVLKPGGLIAITIKPKDKWSELQRSKTAFATLYLGTDLTQMLAEAGFRDVRVEVCPDQDKFPGECVLGVK